MTIIFGDFGFRNVGSLIAGITALVSAVVMIQTRNDILKDRLAEHCKITRVIIGSMYVLVPYILLRSRWKHVLIIMLQYVLVYCGITKIRGSMS